MQTINKTKSIISENSNDLSDPKNAEQVFSEEQLTAVNDFVNRTTKRLQNFDRLLEEKIEKFNNLTTSVKLNRRMLFLLPDINNFDAYIEQKIEDKKKQEQLTKAKLVIKMIAALVMSVSFLLIAKTMYQMLSTEVKRFDLAKVIKEKTKPKKLKKKKRIS